MISINKEESGSTKKEMATENFPASIHSNKEKVAVLCAASAPKSSINIPTATVKEANIEPLPTILANDLLHFLPKSPNNRKPMMGKRGTNATNFIIFFIIYIVYFKNLINSIFVCHSVDKLSLRH